MNIWFEILIKTLMDSLFLIKKIIANLFAPLPLTLLLLLLAMYFLLLRQRKATGISLGLAILLLGFSSLGPVGESLITPFELRKPHQELTQVDAIVALGHGHKTNPELTLTGQMYNEGLARVTEAVIQHKRFPMSQLYFSGDTHYDPMPQAEFNRQLAIALGVPDDKITSLAEVYDTRQEVAVLAPHLKDKTVLLVSSASHLPRAIRLFEQQGISVIPWPTDNKAKGESSGFLAWFPRASGLRTTERAMYESLSTLWVIFTS